MRQRKLHGLSDAAGCTGVWPGCRRRDSVAGATPEEVEAVRRLQVEEQMKKEAEEKAELERQEAEEAELRRKRHEEWVCTTTSTMVLPLTFFKLRSCRWNLFKSAGKNVVVS